MSDALRLPARPHLEHYKKLAKDLLRAARSGDPAELRDWIRRLEPDPANAAHFEKRWRQFQDSKKGAPQLTHAQFFVAREHGFASWPKFARHIEALQTPDTPVALFEAAADAIASGDLKTLERLLRVDPRLIRARSTRDHNSTLLHYVSANGIEDYRQKTPPNIVEITKYLLDRGADVNAESEAYGGHSTTLELAATSVHPQRAGVQIALLRLLLDRGAKMDDGLISSCMANGQPEAADFLVTNGAPVDLGAAAALGSLERVKDVLDKSPQSPLQPALLYAAGYGRLEVVKFLLGKGADVAWTHRNGNSSLHWAAEWGHRAVVEVLLQHGARVDVREKFQDATPLDFALRGWERHRNPNLQTTYAAIVDSLINAGAVVDDRYAPLLAELRQQPPE
ncbi:MAG: ankyrin repeat domain-containing protein [Acidobacteriaceae bacterium]|nr:ankyrin repeat domain-containing protein [Acidobacteriaceae bacterium]